MVVYRFLYAYVFNSLGEISRGVIAGLYGKSVCNFISLPSCLPKWLYEFAVPLRMNEFLLFYVLGSMLLSVFGF